MTDRLEFTAATKREARDRAAGICECPRLAHLKIPGIHPDGCGVRFTAHTGRYYEHINQAFVRDDNSLENCAVLVRTCWRLKTDYCDLPTVARVKNRRDTNDGITKPRSKLRKPPGHRYDWSQHRYVKET